MLPTSSSSSSSLLLSRNRDSTRHRSRRSIHSSLSSASASASMVTALPSPPVRDGAVALPNVPHVVTLSGARVVLWDTAKRRADKLARDHVQALASLLVVGSDRQREDVAAILANAACDKSNRVEIAAAGAVPLLVSAVSASNINKALAGKATRALANLAWQNRENQRLIETSGGVDALVELLAIGSDVDLQDEAATALSHLLEHREIAERMNSSRRGDMLRRLAEKGSDSQCAQASWLLAKIACFTIQEQDIEADIPALVQMLTGGDKSHYSKRAAAVLRRLSDDVKYKSEIVVAGGLTPLIGLLQYGTERQRVDAAWTLGHLAWNAFSQAQIANAGAIVPLLKLLQSSNVREREGSVWALRHLSGTTDNRTRIASAEDGVSTLVQSVRSAGSACEREHAIATLKNVACNADNQTAIGSAGAIPLLVSVLTKGTPTQINEALAALRNLVRNNNENQARLGSARGIRALVDVLSSGTEIQRLHAAATLINVSCDGELQSEIVAEGALPPLLLLTECENEALLEQVIQLLRNLIWNNDANQGRIGASGMIQRVVSMLRSESDGLKKQAAALLRNLAWQNTANQDRIQECGGIPSLVTLLGIGTTGQREQAAGAIANLAWNNSAIQEEVAQSNGLAMLADMTGRGNEKLQKQASLALRHFVFGENKKVKRAAPSVIPSLVRLLASGSNATHQQQATWTLANLACNPDNKIEIVSSGGTRPLIDVLATGTNSQKQYAASALANLACSVDHKKKIMAAKGVAPLIDLVSEGTDGQKKQAAWALRNIAWDCTEGQATIATAGGVPALVQLVRAGSDSHKEHAAAALANLACLDANQNKIAAVGGIQALVELAERGTDSSKQQAAWALANLAMSPSNRANIIDAGGIAALQSIVTNGRPDQQRGASAALARINDPGRYNYVTNESHAVFRTPSDGSEESDKSFRDLLRPPSMRSNATVDSRRPSLSPPQEIKIGRALYRSIGSVPEIVTRTPSNGGENGVNRSPAGRLTHSVSLGVRRTPEHRQHVLNHLPSVQEATESNAAIEASSWTLENRDLLELPESLPLRRAQSANPPTRVAYRMPASPLEQSRTNRPLLPRPSTLGDLLDPHGGYSPPKEQVLRRNVARVPSDMDVVRKPLAKNPLNVNRENMHSNSHSIYQNANTTGGRTVQRSDDRGSQGSRGSYDDNGKIDLKEEILVGMQRRNSSRPTLASAVNRQTHRNSGDENSKFFGSMPAVEQSAHEEVYEYDENHDPFHLPQERESKYPTITL